MSGRTWRYLAQTSVAAFAMASANGGALAQTVTGSQPAGTAAPANQTDGANVVAQGDDIVVTGLRASIERGIQIKRDAAGIVDAITAEDMGKFPDLNLSESLQRIPGVTINRNANGEGQAINLRGLGPQFTRVELNGMTGLGNGTGGPARSTLFYTLYLYFRGFQDFQMGYASAMAWILVIVVGALAAVFFWSSKHWVHYSGEGK